MPPEQSQKLNDALRDQHVPADILIYPGVEQNFGTNGVADPAANAKALADMEDFIVKIFPPPAKNSAKPNPARTAKSKARK